MQEYQNAASICLQKGKVPSRIEVELPASKSISNRLLVLKDLSKKKIEIKNLSTANDTQLLQSILGKNEEAIDVEDAGTAARFGLAWACLKNTPRTISGTARLNQRPMTDLINALRELGFSISCTKNEGFFPVAISPINLEKIGSKVKINASKSSQFVSALCLVGTFLPMGLKIELMGEINSKPYISMTLKLLKEVGAKHLWKGNKIEIKNNTNLFGKVEVEPDWSAAAFWYELASIYPTTKIVLKGLHRNSLQGDAVAQEQFKKLGVKSVFLPSGIEIVAEETGICLEKIDFKNTPDLAQAFLVACALQKVPVVVSGLQTLRGKETDRILALQNELKFLGAQLTEKRDKFYLSCGIYRMPEELGFKVYNDHRMAMAFAMCIFKSNKVRIENPAVVNKSYPHFWEQLKKFGIEITL